MPSRTFQRIFIACTAYVAITFFSSCNPDEELEETPDGSGNVASVTTLAVSNIAGSTATSGGNIANTGGSAITQRGVVWGTTPNPTTANSFTNDGSGSGSFTSNLNDLTANTTYYVRAYATNSAGTAYGNELTFTTTAGGGGSGWLNPNLTYGSMTDQDGNTYATIVIGTQDWMAEDLRTTTYANGDPIPNVTDYNEWLSLTTGAWANHYNDSEYEIPYGKLYNWYTVADPRNVCPTGWHVPTDAEWSTMINYLDPNATNVGAVSSDNAGGKMKSTGTQYWYLQNSDATNESGFSGLPNSLRSVDGEFPNIGDYGHWWSSTQSDYDVAWARALNKYNDDAWKLNTYKQVGCSVRCLRD
jgi:uncharacterized protein (TIGR02145 family)